MALTFRPTEPVDLAAVFPPPLLEQQLKVDPAGVEGALITALARAACGWVERYTSTSLTARSWLVTLDAFSPVLALPIGPVRAVTAIDYRGADDAAASLALGGWRFAGSDIRPIGVDGWPARASEIAITVTAGYDTPGTEAPALVAASFMMLTHLWRNREGQGDPATIGAPAGVIALCDLDRTPVLA